MNVTFEIDAVDAQEAFALGLNLLQKDSDEHCFFAPNDRHNIDLTYVAAVNVDDHKDAFGGHLECR